MYYQYYSDKLVYEWRKTWFKFAAFVFVCALYPAYLGLMTIPVEPDLSVLSILVFMVLNGVALSLFLEGVDCEMEISHRKKKKEAEELRKFEMMLYD